MLDKIRKLNDSLNDEQFATVSDVIGPDIYELFIKTLKSKNEEDAKVQMKKLSASLSKHPMAAFKLYNKLNSEQKGIILELMEDENE